MWSLGLIVLVSEDRKQEAKEFKVKGKAKGKQDVQVPPPMPWEGFHHVPMNLPASALEFLGKNFRSALLSFRER